MFWVDRVHIRCCGNGGLGFRPDGDSLFLTNASKKVSKKKARPGVRPLAGARCSFAPAFIWGHRLRSASRRPPLDVCGFAARRYAPTPQMNASTQPAEGAGRSRSKAGELPLGLLSGEERGDTSIYCGSWPAGDGGLSADHSLPATPLIVPYAPRGNAARDALRSEGAGGSKAAGELPLGLLSGEERSVYADPLCGVTANLQA
ncbi:hypothetical protein HNR03_003087 [Pseudomonas sp. JAI111]|nr:hypothetical protein [Pseudomonas sp. JAI111]